MTDSQHDAAPARSQQLPLLRELIAALGESNAFYQPRLKSAGLDRSVESIEAYIASMPFTYKHELIDNQRDHPPYGTNLTDPLSHYTRFCQTSGTTGAPLRVIDTPDSWQVMLDSWREVFTSAGVGAGDRVFFAFSFGPFLGFWTAFEAALQMNIMAIPGGGMSTTARLSMIAENAVDTLCCTPTYAIRLAQAADEAGVDLSQCAVKRIIVAGEPGGSIAATRDLISKQWSGIQTCRVFDHHGMTEVGPVTYQNAKHPGVLHIMGDAFLPEVIDPAMGEPVARGAVGELVLTTLRRIAWPLLRYRTGDLVRQATRTVAELDDANFALEGGILGRADDMVVVRGVNVFPAAIDRIVRQFDEVAEYRVKITEERGMNELELIVEAVDETKSAELCSRIASALRDALQLRVPVTAAKAGELPRFEMKAKRWICS